LWLLGPKSIAELLRLAENKLLIYDKGIDRRAILGENMDFDNPEGPQFACRTGDILMPEVKFAEPVRVEAEQFLDCIRYSQEPLTGLAHVRTVVSILKRARPLNGEVKHGNLTA
jgi:hypothetical protein